MNEDEFNLYVLAEGTYKKKFLNQDDIFPEDWYSNKNYHLKTEIIMEAVKNNIKIKDTKLYQEDFIEGIIKNT